MRSNHALVRPTRRRPHTVIWRWARWIVPFAAAVVTAELLVRVVAPQPASWLPIYALHPSKPMPRLLPNASVLVDTGEARWSVHTDAQGLRIPESGRPEKSAPVALVLGDSQTFGYSTTEESTFARVLDTRYGERCQVINAGQPSHGPLQYRYQLEHLLAVGYRPTVVVCVMYAGNDLLDLLVDKEQTVAALNRRPGFWEPVKRASHLYRLASRAYHRVFSKSPYYVHMPVQLVEPETWRMPDMVRAGGLCRDELQTIKQICDRHGAALFVAILPVPLAIDSLGGRVPVRPGTDSALPQRKVAEACDAAGVPWLDLSAALAVLPVRETFFAFDGHLNAVGHRLVADALEARIASSIHPPASSPSPTGEVTDPGPK